MKAAKKSAKAEIWTGGKNVVLRGALEPLIVDDVQQTYTNYEGTIVGLPVQLFHAGRVWWLHYGFDNNTGGFKSKKDATRWWTNGGR